MTDAEHHELVRIRDLARKACAAYADETNDPEAFVRAMQALYEVVMSQPPWDI